MATLAIREAVAVYEADWRQEERGKALSPAQLRVLRLLCRGLTDREIARRLGISHFTVHRHLVAIYARLGTNNRVATVIKALQQGFLE